MLDLYDEFRAVVSSLSERSIEYAVCGGLAVSVYCEPRATVDIDLLILPEDYERAKEAAQALGYTIEGPPMTFVHGAIEIRRLSKVEPESGDSLPLDLLLAGDMPGAMMRIHAKPPRPKPPRPDTAPAPSTAPAAAVDEPKSGLAGLTIKFTPPEGSNVSPVTLDVSALTGRGTAFLPLEQGVPLPVAGTLKPIVDTFDKTWYGFENVSAEQFAEYAKKVDELTKGA